MPFKRVWDSSCPKEYDRWETDDTTWVIQDLPPEDDEQAVKLLVEHLIPDEALCVASGLKGDELSVISISHFWRLCLAKRTSLACYAHKQGSKTLVAVNCCIVMCDDDDEDICEIEGNGWPNVYNALHYAETRVNIFELFKLDKVLYGQGLVVRRDNRGDRLGGRMLQARKPLSLAQGVRASSTVFTSIASQKSAERAGFTTVAVVSFGELADSGLNYPRNEHSIKYMVKRFDTD